MDYSLSDLKAIVDDRDDGVFGGNGFLWIILIFLFFIAFSGNGFGSWGNNGNAGLAQVERDVLTTSCETQKGVMKSQYDTLLGFKDQQMLIQNCCCENRLAICNQTNTLATAIHSEGEATRALIQENTIQELRDRLATANSALTTQTIVNDVVQQLRPCPVPAYPVCGGNLFGYYGYNNGCNGCNGNF